VSAIAWRRRACPNLKWKTLLRFRSPYPNLWRCNLSRTNPIRLATFIVTSHLFMSLARAVLGKLKVT